MLSANMMHHCFIFALILLVPLARASNNDGCRLAWTGPSEARMHQLRYLFPTAEGIEWIRGSVGKGERLQLRVWDHSGGLHADVRLGPEVDRYEVGDALPVGERARGFRLEARASDGGLLEECFFGVVPYIDRWSAVGAMGNDAFGVVGSPSLVRGEGLNMLRLSGASWVRYRGLRWTQQNDRDFRKIRGDPFVKSWEKLQRHGFNVLVQLFGEQAPVSAKELSIAHRGRKTHLDEFRFAAWAKKVGQALPEFTHFKLLNERDRDPRSMYLEAYARLMVRGADALKAVRPDTTIYIEGGYTPTIVSRLLLRGLYEPADAIDHHLYGRPSALRGFGARVRLAREAGFEGKIVATEFGIVPGQGKPAYPFAEAPGDFVKKVSLFFAEGGSRFFYFVWSFLGDGIHKGFHSIYLVTHPESQPLPIYFSYAWLSQLFTDLNDIPFWYDDDTDSAAISMRSEGVPVVVLWSEKGVLKAKFQGDGPYRVYDAAGSHWLTVPSGTGLTVLVAEKPLIVSSKSLSGLASTAVRGNAQARLREADGQYLLDAAGTSSGACGDGAGRTLTPAGWTVQDSASGITRVTPPAGIMAGRYSVMRLIEEGEHRVCLDATSLVDVGQE